MNHEDVRSFIVLIVVVFATIVFFWAAAWLVALLPWPE